MGRVKIAEPASTFEMWPADSLDSWRCQPKESFRGWIAEQRVVNDRQFRLSSVHTYESMFMWWVQSLNGKKLNVLEATIKDATEFFNSKDMKPHSRRRYLQLLDRVYAYLRKIGWQGENPLLLELKKERELDAVMPLGLDDTTLSMVIQVLSAMPGWKGYRDRCAAALLIGAGLRACQLANLRQEDVDLHYSIKVRAISIYREHTTVVLPDGPWRQWIDDWISNRSALRVHGDFFCPATLNGNLFSATSVFRRTLLWLPARTESLPKAGPNLLRNTFARQALLSGRYAVEQIQEFLGHMELRATTRHIAAIELVVTA